MILDPDPLWYDREDPDEPVGLLCLVLSIGLVSLARLFFLPEEMWPEIKRATVAAFRDVEETHS
ncbi:hypothetical protein [Methylorubrum sp. SL192]|uniref:hypothetical protein n=1 Tax=Methylorubrum sp. SL192 TaxID=2995167 RepID=UPI002274A93A|nr:hypothetical protein [Methylorubrum sp. SL192]MCY1641028.1 hypothetical protein [Methylorubrum sp. SL192]